MLHMVVLAHSYPELEPLCLPETPSIHKIKYSLLWHKAMSVLNYVFKPKLLSYGRNLNLHHAFQTLPPLYDPSPAVRHLNKTEIVTDSD